MYSNESSKLKISTQDVCGYASTYLSRRNLPRGCDLTSEEAAKVVGSQDHGFITAKKKKKKSVMATDEAEIKTF